MYRRFALAAALLSAAVPAMAESLVAARTIRAQAILGPGDVTVSDSVIPGALTDLSEVIGLEARTVIYPGRPIQPSDIGVPALVARNQIVPLHYVNGTLSIMVEGRALGRGAVGERIRVMNLGSRTTVTGVVMPDGSLRVDSAGASLVTSAVQP
ncbi:MAG: flagellar basal body P-ring formation protein FlgA [Rhodobacteraceae bacterium]|nr:flagellar basal body P-ring formation protein FlgA [Paracoccaceae bacterium]